MIIFFQKKFSENKYNMNMDMYFGLYIEKCMPAFMHYHHFLWFYDTLAAKLP